MPVRRQLLRLAAVALLSGGCTPPPKPTPVLVPPLADGACWVRFYEHADFGAPMRQIDGPTLVEATAGSMIQGPGIAKAPPQPLLAEARSLEIGPGARLTGYRGTMFRGEASVLAPATRVPQAPAVGYPERFASFKIHCPN